MQQASRLLRVEHLLSYICCYLGIALQQPRLSSWETLPSCVMLPDDIRHAVRVFSVMLSRSYTPACEQVLLR
jgi:hypothetical protein